MVVGRLTVLVTVDGLDIVLEVGRETVELGVVVVVPVGR